jgi:homoserine kinase type II
MSRVFLLQHLHLLNGDEEDVKTLGVYSSREEALAAVKRFRLLPGFSDMPDMANPSLPGPAEGFSIDEYELNQDSWADGYSTV